LAGSRAAGSKEQIMKINVGTVDRAIRIVAD
jgi:hypothetical protein